MKKTCFLLISIFLNCTALAQTDTIPILLQKAPIPIASAVFRGEDSIIALTGMEISLSTDDGVSFSPIASTGGNVYLAKTGPLIRISSDMVERSYDAGHSWQNTQSPIVTTLNYISTDGRRYSFSHNNRDYITTNFGDTWDTITYNGINTRPAFESWLDAGHGVRQGSVLTNALISTSDSGKTWDTLIWNKDSLEGISFSGQLQYPAPGVIAFSFNNGLLISNDTGRTWSYLRTLFVPNSPEYLTVLSDDNWLSTSSGAIIQSSDKGKTWSPVDYTCPNWSNGTLVFRDSLHGINLSHQASIAANTSDGGLTWNCMDTKIYVTGAGAFMSTDVHDSNSYFSLANVYDQYYVCRSKDRGVTWDTLFPAPSDPVVLGEKFFFAPISPDNIVWTFDFGKTFHSYNLAYKQGSCFVAHAPDGTLWAGKNGGTFLISTDSGQSWNDVTSQLPLYPLSSSQVYQFIPVDSVTGFVQIGTGSGGDFQSSSTYRTTDAGLTWLLDSIAPDYVINSRNWVSPSWGRKTSDGGRSWISFNARPEEIPGNNNTGNFFAVDSNRWYYLGNYTTDAGLTWMPIPGWNSVPNWPFTIVDFATAFSSSGPPLYRLDLPFKGSKIQNSVSVPEAYSSANITVYPNPSNGLVTIRGAAGAVEVTNMMGERVTTFQSPPLAEQGKLTLDLSKLPAGTYFARIETANGIVVRKILKE